MKKHIHTAIVTDLKQSADEKRAEIDKRYHKYDGYVSYGILAPKLDQILKGHKSDIQELNCPQSLEVAQQLYQSHIEEQLMAGNYILALKSECLSLPQQLEYLDKLADNFTSWSTVDDFCIDVLQSLLLRQPKETLALLHKWNKSENMWKRRASVVAFVRKVGESGKFTKEIIKLCDNLKTDSEDLVQKGVGWTLKAAMRGDKAKVLAYVKKLREEGVSSTITLYAIRDLRESERRTVLETKRFEPRPRYDKMKG